MTMLPGRAPFSKEENFTPLRAPKTGPLQSNLSVTAQEFVPRPHHEQTQDFYHHQQQQQQQMQCNPEPYLQPVNQYQHQYVQQQQQQPPQQQQYYKYHNGFQQGQQRHPNAHYHQQQQQQQNHQPYSQQQMNNITSDIQSRLTLNGPISGGGGGGGGGNGNGAYNKTTGGNNYMGNPNRSKPNNPNHSQQSRLQKHQNNHQQQRHYQNNHNQHHQQQQQQQQQQPSSSTSNAVNGYENTEPDMESLALNYLTTVIQCLNHNPGEFDTVATRFPDIFEGMENNQKVLSIAMEDIFNESIQNSNFRYMGAKLYNLLHMLNPKPDSLFLTLLKCKLDYHQQEVLDFMKQNEHGKVRETALFLAELYMQLRGDDNRIQLLAENIVFSLKQLLGIESVENIRCICLTLKLAGYDLSMDCKEDILQIIQALQDINDKSPPNKYPIVASVLALQKENWGRKLSSSSSFSHNDGNDGAYGPSAPLRSSDEPIFYGPDGRELTAEEAEFLHGGAMCSQGGYTDEDDEEADDDFDTEMDAEAAKAYREFRKLNSSAS